MEKTLSELQNEYKALEIESGKYNRPEFDTVYSIIADLIKDRHDIGDKGDLAFPLVTGNVIDEALRLSGFAEDKGFVADFFKYRNIEQQARDIQLKGIKCSDSPQKKALQQDVKADEWQFIQIRIFAPQPLMRIIDRIVESDLQNNKGLFANITDIPKEDEFEDDFLMIDTFDVKSSFVPYLDELKQYKIVGVDGFLNDEFKKCLLSTIMNEANFIKHNTDKPSKVKNHIIDTLTELDKLPIWGLFFQILTLQGLCRWMESLNISDDDNGYQEAQSLHSWIYKGLMRKEVQFCYMPFGEADKERLKPLCDYLYSTEIGKIAQNHLFNKNYSISNLQNENLKQPEVELISISPTEEIGQPKSNVDEIPQKIIKESEIRKLFCAKLNKPLNNAGITHGGNLISSLKTPRVKKNGEINFKEYARIALIMYSSPYIITDDDFAVWLRNFYTLVGLEIGFVYKKHELVGKSKELNDEFRYLIDTPQKTT